MNNTTFDFQDGNGPVLAHRHKSSNTHAGYIGGWVADTTTVADTVFVGENARVFGHVQLSGIVYVNDLAHVSDAGWSWDGEPIPSLDVQRILAREILVKIEDGGRLAMAIWHTCQTAHCLAGWCQVLREGEADDHGAYEAGVRHLPALAPYFFVDDKKGFQQLKKFAGVTP